MLECPVVPQPEKEETRAKYVRAPTVDNPKLYYEDLKNNRKKIKKSYYIHWNSAFKEQEVKSDLEERFSQDKILANQKKPGGNWDNHKYNMKGWTK